MTVALAQFATAVEHAASLRQATARREGCNAVSLVDAALRGADDHGVHPQRLRLGWGARSLLRDAPWHVAGGGSALVLHGRRPHVGAAIRGLLGNGAYGRAAVLVDTGSDRATGALLDALHGMLAARRHDCLMAVGGGRVLDLAKRVVARMDEDTRASVAFLAWPTTAGSGSEATRFATVFTEQGKRSIEHPTLRPDWVVVDPAACLSLSPLQRAVGALDCLCHLIESQWSLRASVESRRWVAAGLDVLRGALIPAVLRPGRHGLERLAAATYCAGRAIDLSRTTAAHAFSYYLTGVLGVPHGLAVAAAMAGVVQELEAQAREASAGAALRVLADTLDAVGAAPAESLHRRWSRLLQDLCVASCGGIACYDESVARAWVNPERLANHPCPVDVESLCRRVGQYARGLGHRPV